MRKISQSTTLVLSISACAPGACIASDCVTIDAKFQRLACYDNESDRANKAGARKALSKAEAPVTNSKGDNHAETIYSSGKEEGADATEDSWLLKNLKIRDVLAGSTLDSSTKGAALNITHEHETTTYALKAAAILNLGNIGFPQFMRDHGWGWKAGGQFTKDTSKTKPVDGRTIALGGLGTITLPYTHFVSTLDLQYVEDRVAKTSDSGVRFATNLVLPCSEILETRRQPDLGEPSWFIYPIGGLHIDRHREKKIAKDTLYGGHIGLTASLYPRGTLQPLRLFADAVRARDFNRAKDGSKRDSTLYDFGLDYAFVPPTEKSRHWRPTLTLKRTIGSNFLTGEADTAKTALFFTVKFK